MLTIGFDTSNYTTSCACFNGTDGQNFSQLLDVRPGELGLRQSDAVFSHIKRLPDLSDRLFAHLDASLIGAIGASTRPRAIEGSYMPCFLVGQSHARILASALKVPLYEFSHQQGHIAAALWSAGRLDLIKTQFLAWHLSGGTTELLLVSPSDNFFKIEIIGGTTDISAGQLIDRTGKMLGLSFPAGKELDKHSRMGTCSDFFKLKVNDSHFSFSGVQNQIEKYRREGASSENTARFCLNSVCLAVTEATNQALKKFPGVPVLFSGGVSSNSSLRASFSGERFLFADPALSTDNALGTAVLAYLKEKE